MSSLGAEKQHNHAVEGFILHIAIEQRLNHRGAIG
jgi:hypothetical protein